MKTSEPNEKHTLEELKKKHDALKVKTKCIVKINWIVLFIALLTGILLMMFQRSGIIKYEDTPLWILPLVGLSGVVLCLANFVMIIRLKDSAHTLECQEERQAMESLIAELRQSHKNPGP